MDTNADFVGKWEGLIGETRRKGITSLYNSDKWEFGIKTFYRKSWKNYRKNQFKNNAVSFKAIYNMVVEEGESE